MEFETVVRRRRMVRSFRPDPIDQETIRNILDLARRGPSAGFTQGQFFVVVTDPKRKAEIARLCYEEKYVEGGFDPFISGAPVLIIPCTSEAAYHRRYQEDDKVQEDGSEINWPVPYWYMDVGCAVMLLLLAAVENGLAAGFAGAHDLTALQALLGIPSEVTPMGVIPMGYPAEDKKSPSLKRGRKTDTEVFHWERW